VSSSTAPRSTTTVRTIDALKSFLKSPALLSAIVFASGGIGFAAGNILLARVLPEEEYGRVALFLAITQLGITLGPLGIDTVINRHRLSASGSLLGRVSFTSVAVGVLLAVTAFVFYEFGAALAAILALTVLGAAVNRVGGSFFQSKQKFGLSLFLILVHNWIVLCAVPVVLIADGALPGGPSALPAAMTIAAGYVLMAALGWRKSFAMRRESTVMSGRDGEDRPGTPAAPTLLREGLAVVGVQVAVAAFFQLDRLLIPNLLSIRDLAVYSVVSAIAASPFRMLQTGLGFSLLPRVRACTSREAIRKLVRHEIGVAVAMAGAASVVVLLLTPWLISLLLDSRYDFHMSLLYALVVVGFVRVWNGISSAVVSALSSPRQLMAFNACSWGSLILAAGCAWAARGGGLTGIVYGLGVGWLASAVAGTLIGLQAVARRSEPGVACASDFADSGSAAPRSSIN
jgi:O-antigen/teichoic acid export membrane protein